MNEIIKHLLKAIEIAEKHIDRDKKRDEQDQDWLSVRMGLGAAISNIYILRAMGKRLINFERDKDGDIENICWEIRPSN
jgi:hypothetical protein